ERDIMLEARAFGDVDAPLRSSGPSDLWLRVELFEEASRGGFSDGVCSRLRLGRGAGGAVERGRDQLAPRSSRAPSSARAPAAPAETRVSVIAGVGAGSGRHSRPYDAPTGTARATTLLRCVLAAFPDRLVRRRAPGSARGVMVGGTGVVLDRRSVVRDAEL